LGLNQEEVRVLFKNVLTTTADEKLVLFVEDLNSLAWLWREIDLLSLFIHQASTVPHCSHKLVCFLKPYIDSHLHISEVRSIFVNGSKSCVIDMKRRCASLQLHISVLPTNQCRILKAAAVVQWVLHSRLALQAGSIDSRGHFASTSSLVYKGPIHSLCLLFESMQSSSRNSICFAQALCEDLLANGVHEQDVIFYRRIFLDFLDGRVDFDDESSFECLISSFPRCRSLLYALTELICAYLERSVLRPAFFGLCSKQMDVPFFNDKSTQFPNNIKTKRGKCLDLKTKLQSAVDNVDSMLPDLICDQ
jgi:hypothetical protein